MDISGKYPNQRIELQVQKYHLGKIDKKIINTKKGTLLYQLIFHQKYTQLKITSFVNWKLLLFVTYIYILSVPKIMGPPSVIFERFGIRKWYFWNVFGYIESALKNFKVNFRGTPEEATQNLIKTQLKNFTRMKNFRGGPLKYYLIV